MKVNSARSFKIEKPNPNLSKRIGLGISKANNGFGRLKGFVQGKVKKT